MNIVFLPNTFGSSRETRFYGSSQAILLCVTRSDMIPHQQVRSYFPELVAIHGAIQAIYQIPVFLFLLLFIYFFSLMDVG